VAFALLKLAILDGALAAASLQATCLPLQQSREFKNAGKLL